MQVVAFLKQSWHVANSAQKGSEIIRSTQREQQHRPKGRSRRITGAKEIIIHFCQERVFLHNNEGPNPDIC